MSGIRKREAVISSLSLIFLLLLQLHLTVFLPHKEMTQCLYFSKTGKSDIATASVLGVNRTILIVWLVISWFYWWLPLMTKPKLFPSLCKQMSIVFDITPEVLSGALRQGRWGRRGRGRWRERDKFMTISEGERKIIYTLAVPIAFSRIICFHCWCHGNREYSFNTEKRKCIN